MKRNEGIVEYAMDYGLPGKPGYTYSRPFDLRRMDPKIWATQSVVRGP